MPCKQQHRRRGAPHSHTLVERLPPVASSTIPATLYPSRARSPCAHQQMWGERGGKRGGESIPPRVFCCLMHIVSRVDEPQAQAIVFPAAGCSDLHGNTHSIGGPRRLSLFASWICTPRSRTSCMIYPSALHTRPGKPCILPRIPRYVVVENRVVLVFHFVTGGLPPLQICPPPWCWSDVRGDGAAADEMMPSACVPDLAHEIHSALGSGGQCMQPPALAWLFPPSGILTPDATQVLSRAGASGGG